MSAALVELSDLTRDFAGARAVDGLTLEVGPGEVLGLLGPNGAGKTTALRMIAGLLTPTHGLARVCGADVQRDPLTARRALGFLTASTGLYDRLTPRELMEIFGGLFGLTAQQIALRVKTLAEELDLEGFLDRRCGTLSSGQRQRASIARAVVHDPQVYVLDEPTAMLDPLASTDILALVRRAQARQKAVLFSTHRMEEAQYLCTRLVFLRAGRAVAQGTCAQLLEASAQPTLTGAFLHYAGRA